MFNNRLDDAQFLQTLREIADSLIQTYQTDFLNASCLEEYSVVKGKIKGVNRLLAEMETAYSNFYKNDN